MIIENLYISPLEACNLNCRYCYTHKTKNVLSNQQILKFVSQFPNLKSIIFCGGEVFTLADFPSLVNQLINQNIFITIITNGTIDRLAEIKDPTNCQLLVSFDGPKEIHDYNRGSGNFDKSCNFVKHALDLNFPTEIFFLITKDSYKFKDSFNLFDLPKTYLVDRLGSLSATQTKNILKNYSTYPNKNFGCFQLSLQSDGLVYGCCESAKSIGTISTPSKILIKNFNQLLSPCLKCQHCSGCVDQSFFCGLTKNLCKNSCKEVVKLLNDH
ncbi:MAG TPA: radical SAM protein [Candidatus Woesebacteria bacterium]|nr:radical SAM protein [Candidatus Woesebacteria bacterium]HPJ17242.1 radical SAM protein [Candidatus Woesebacteria bacterium]